VLAPRKKIKEIKSIFTFYRAHKPLLKTTDLSVNHSWAVKKIIGVNFLIMMQFLLTAAQNKNFDIKERK
jgi:hypothetical protein